MYGWDIYSEMEETLKLEHPVSQLIYSSNFANVRESCWHECWDRIQHEVSSTILWEKSTNCRYDCLKFIWILLFKAICPYLEFGHLNIFCKFLHHFTTFPHTDRVKMLDRKYTWLCPAGFFFCLFSFHGMKYELGSFHSLQFICNHKCNKLHHLFQLELCVISLQNEAISYDWMNEQKQIDSIIIMQNHNGKTTNWHWLNNYFLLNDR